MRPYCQGLCPTSTQYCNIIQEMLLLACPMLADSTSPPSPASINTPRALGPAFWTGSTIPYSYAGRRTTGSQHHGPRRTRVHAVVAIVTMLRLSNVLEHSYVAPETRGLSRTERNKHDDDCVLQQHDVCSTDIDVKISRRMPHQRISLRCRIPAVEAGLNFDLLRTQISRGLSNRVNLHHKRERRIHSA